jgi:hypothetical protein
MYSRKSLLSSAALVTIVSLSSVLTAAHAGGASSAPSKYNSNYSSHSAEIHHSRVAQTRGFLITEFSSSSAKRSAPHR